MIKSENNKSIKECTKENIECLYFNKCFKKNILSAPDKSINLKKIESKLMIPSSDSPPKVTVTE